MRCRPLLPDFGFQRARGLQSSQEVNQIPGILWLDIVGKRRHWRPVEAGHENAIEVSIGFSALEPRTGSEVIGAQRIVFAIGERRGRRSIAAARRTMALPALHFLIDLPTLQNAGASGRSFDGNVDGLSGRFLFPPGGKRLDVGDEVSAVM